jgi:inner membrane protein
MAEEVVQHTPIRMKSNVSLFFKIALVAVIALLMLIPLAMVKSLVRERQNYADGCRAEVAQSWGNAQTLAGPAIVFSYDQNETDAEGKKVVRHLKKTVYPKDLHYDVTASTQKLHRSIYDVMVYRADVMAEGSFILPKDLAGLDIKSALVTLGISDLRGIEGNVALSLNGQDYVFSEGSAGGRDDHAHIQEALSLNRQLMDDVTVLPFSLRFKMKGSETLSVRPYGELTQVHVHSDCPDPSFTGDFLPSEREVRSDGFDAQWVVSQINRGKPDDTSFGVRMLQPVTQYRQSERSVKYGILIILLVFIAGLAVLLNGKDVISLVY